MAGGCDEHIMTDTHTNSLLYNYYYKDIVPQDNMNRQLNCMVSRAGDTAGTLAEELVLHGFIHTLDSSLIQVNNYIRHRSSNYYIIISSM